MNAVAQKAISWTESGLVPDRVIRGGIRRLNHSRLESLQADDPAQAAETVNQLVREMNKAQVALVPELANEQHYELPAEFFAQVLGKHGKYSCCYWGAGAENLDQAERDALAITCERAGIEDGQAVLDLGCGWGSLSLWIAEHYPSARVTAVSNSNLQRRWIERQAAERELDNLRVITQDMNTFAIGQKFDRVVSVEMFEHMRNWGELCKRISQWLKPEGRFFMHVFCHRSAAYAFTDNGPSDWMSRYFFSGGIMPSADLPLRFQDHLKLVKRFAWDGREYQQTANAWLEKLDANKDKVAPWLGAAYGPEAASQWFQRWRIFFMACAETFGYREGKEWMVGHYLFEPRANSSQDNGASNEHSDHA